MARQAGLIKMTGKMGGISFYQSKYGWLARGQTGVSAERLKTAPEFERTREHNTEFGACSIAGRILRHSLGTFIKGLYDGGMNQRLCAVMQKIKDLDEVRYGGSAKWA